MYIQKLYAYYIHLAVFVYVWEFFGLSKMTSGLTKCRKLLNVVKHDIIWTNQNTKYFVFLCLRAHAMFDVTCFSAFIGASEVNSSGLSIR